ncbi:MAG: heavy metal translocating P-type ATPase [Clostridia bacterium]|nr:heavy metal translocating P-type ATPase [Clostridia bacterium]
MKQVLKIKGLDCAGCAAELERQISKMSGVSAASVSFVNQKIVVEYDTAETLEKIVDAVNHFEDVKVINDGGRVESNAENYKKNWLLIALSATFFLVAVLFEKLASGLTAEIARYVFYAAAYSMVGYPVLLATVKNVTKGKIFDENFLMTIASIGAVCIGEIGEGVMVMLLYQIGETLQSIAVDSSRRSVKGLMELKSEWANVLTASELKKVKPEQIKVGDVLLVKAGEKIPVDGELLTQTATLDTKSLTGESEHRKAQKGDELLSGCINAGGVFEMRATREYTDSAVSRILDLVENASSGKAAPEKFITKFARVYTPVVCLFALALATLAPLLSGAIVDRAFYFKDFDRWLLSALTFLVISCPCALIISVPLTYFSGIGACAKRGILVKGATYLDVLAKADIFAFDKTGTLTEGNFTVCSVVPATGTTEEELLAVAAALERGSSHPIAKAFESIETPYEATEIEEIAGRGLIGKIQSETVLVGSAELLKAHGVPYLETDSAYTRVYVAKTGEYIGVIEIGDRIRLRAKTAIEALKKLGVARAVMLTGDQTERAKKVANEVGMYEVNAELLPDQKLKMAEALKKTGTLVYVGDGVNDAPVMAVADCAVSMGKLGSAAAVEASDLVLVSDDLGALPRALKIARKTRKIALQNIVFSIVMKTAFMALGLIGLLPLSLAVFADVGVMLLAVCNSFRVKITK